MASKDELQTINVATAKFFTSPAGRHMINWLEEQSQAQFNKARKAPQDEVYGLIKEANGIIKVLEYIKIKTQDVTQ